MIDITGLREDKRPQSSTVVHALLDRLEAAESECLEQARLNGMGSEREAALMAKLETAEKTNKEWLRANAPGGWIDNLRIENEALAANLRGKHSTAGATYAHLIAERDALRAKIGAMEQQEPVAWAATDETCRIVEALSFNQSRRFDTPLYALPGAQGEKMFAWLKRIFDRSADPVHSCDLYRDKEAGSCVHVDGPLCNFPECSMLDDYRQQKEKRND